MKLSGSHLLSFGWLSQHRQKGIKRGSLTPLFRCQKSEIRGQIGAVSKRFQMVRVRGSTQEIWYVQIFRFGRDAGGGRETDF
jgi:hypothetical protein